MKYLLKIRYCGSSYSGFQVQKNAKTIQSALMCAAEKIFTRPCTVTGCSRTDSGVHALEYYVTVATFEGASNISAENLPRAMTANLPEDIAVISAMNVSDDFSVRRAVSGKRYMYLLDTNCCHDPFLVGRAWHYRKRIDIQKVNSAAEKFLGRHDFTSFMASGSEITDAVRCITECRAVECENGIVKIFVAADGFLYNMVRIIVGTLMYVNEGKLSVDDIDKIINAKDRTLAGKTAPSDGLYLEKVFIDI